MLEAQGSPELIGVASNANQTKRLCCRYGFRFVNAPVVASSRSVSEVRDPRGSQRVLRKHRASAAPEFPAPQSIWASWRELSANRRELQIGKTGIVIVEIGSMHIICPHCTTSYAINPTTLGQTGRAVRCSRCRETWLARPEDAAEMMAPAMARASHRSGAADAAAKWEALAREDGTQAEPPMVESPSISGDWPAEVAEPDWPKVAPHDAYDSKDTPRSWVGRFLNPRGRRSGSDRPLISLSTACAAMGALVLALVIWRVDVVRLLPQTAAFYSMVGLDVNLRGLMFKDVKISTETVEGKTVLVIEGAISGETRKPVELPRLRFSVRDAQGAEIYAWNAVLEKPVLQPGERALFKSRLASPPPEGRNIDIRFFNKRDLTGASA
jgi:predicted Zn finger-like uncharacterized protein